MDDRSWRNYFMLLHSNISFTMKPQEIVSVFTEITPEELTKRGSIIKVYPELDAMFEKGMYVEKVSQTCLENGRCMITFIFRYYNMSQSKAD